MKPFKIPRVEVEKNVIQGIPVFDVEEFKLPETLDSSKIKPLKFMSWADTGIKGAEIFDMNEMTFNMGAYVETGTGRILQYFKFGEIKTDVQTIRKNGDEEEEIFPYHITSDIWRLTCRDFFKTIEDAKFALTQEYKKFISMGLFSN